MPPGSMGIWAKGNTKGLERWRARLDRATMSAASKAGGDAARAMRAEASRNIREIKAMKVAAVNKAITIVFPTGKEQLLWRVRASGAPMPLAEFPHRQTKRGVSVMVNKGSRLTVQGAFVATMKSGHEGIFRRMGVASRSPIQRYKGFARYAGQKRQPIKELYTTTVADVFRDASGSAIRRGQEVYRTAFTRLVPIEVAKSRR